MSFTWPDIPFQGSEVTAFAVAYKELAEEILGDYYDDLGPFGDIGKLEMPYVEKSVVKKFIGRRYFICFFHNSTKIWYNWSWYRFCIRK